jgi:non-homologous end joining protein Ku
MRGQRTVLRLGGAEAEVTLIKASAKPREAQYEVRRPATADITELTKGDPLGPDSEPAPRVAAAFAAAVADQPTPTENDGEVRHGVTTEAGGWIDLTEELEAIDARTKLDGMTLEATVASVNVPRERVRDVHYLAPAGEGAPKVLGLLWLALRAQQAVALVRWTKRTNQALGAIVARGEGVANRHLVLLELEWAANMRAVPGRCLLPPVENLDAAVHAARKLVEAYREPGQAIFEALRDERTGQRIELLEAARSGEHFEAPAEKDVPDEAAALADALASAA